MTFKQILQTNSWPTILPIFLDLYPDAKKNMVGYETVFEKLVMMTPEETDMSIVITKEKDDGVEFIEACGVYNNPKNEDANYLQGIELTPWGKWLGMDISKESLNDFSELEIIVHCLYEMTFVGFSEEDIPKALSRIKKNRQERESIPEEERDAITASVEELLKTWRNEDND